MEVKSYISSLYESSVFDYHILKDNIKKGMSLEDVVEYSRLHQHIPSYLIEDMYNAILQDIQEEKILNSKLGKLLYK